MPILINPGAQVWGDGTAPDDVAAALAKDASVLSFKRVGGPDGRGYFDYVFTSSGGGTRADVSIPSVPLERFHERMPVRVYIDGNSWMWDFAVKMLLALDEEETD